MTCSLVHKTRNKENGFSVKSERTRLEEGCGKNGPSLDLVVLQLSRVCSTKVMNPIIFLTPI